MKTSAQIETENPKRLMTRLCKHWAHKFPVDVGEDAGKIELPMGECRMTCTEALTVELEGDAEQMPRFQEVVADHLHRMASKETLAIEWQ